MFSCPHCEKRLHPQRSPQGLSWVCTVCQGRAVALSVLRKVFGVERVKAIWAETLGTPVSDGCACPVCLRAMHRVTWSEPRGVVTLDLCRRCEFVWFDPREYEAITPAPPEPRALGGMDEHDMPPAAREALAMERVQELSKTANDFGEGPDKLWKTVPAVLGFPVEIDTLPEPRAPVATYGLASAIAVISLWAFFLGRNFAGELGLTPAAPGRYHGLTFLTSFFLHGNLIHLVGNLYFLIVFGRQVEEYLGGWRWLLVVGVSALAGDLADIACNAQGTAPLIGASGGISGLLIFYALQFAHARLALLLGYQYYYRWINIPAWGAFALWLIFQFWGAFLELHHASNIASLAHLGGVSAGAGFWQLWRHLDIRPQDESTHPRIQIRS